MFNIILSLGYFGEIQIHNVIYADLMNILSVLDKMKLVENGVEKDIKIQLAPVKMVLCKDGKIIE